MFLLLTQKRLFLLEKCHILIYLFCLIPLLGFGQRPERTLKKDVTEKNEAPLPTRILFDSLGPTSVLSSSSVRLSPDSLDSEVVYGASDSSRFDNISSTFHLYGDAFVNYQNYKLTAYYIRVDMNTNIATAVAKEDSSGHMIGIPSFEDGTNKFSSKRMRFNFKTKKGIIYDVRTRENDVFVHGSKTKFVAKDLKQDRENDYVYNRNALFTTCNLETPHYGIRSNKQKVIPKKLIVVGPSHLEIAGVSTPLWLPFGFFPITSTQRQGLLFPKDYEFSPEWGYGFNDIGYFMPLGEYANLSATLDIYTRGTWRTHVSSQYKKRYKFSGNMSLDYASLKTESTSTGLFARNTNWSFRLSHNQDSKAHPSRRIGGSINIQSGNYRSQNLNDFTSVTTNTFRSNMNYAKNFPGTPFSITASMNHSQNTQTRKVQITLPDFGLKMQRIYPFKRKSSGNNEKWFEKINVTYDLDFLNRVTATDTTIFSGETFDNAQFAMRHQINSNINFKFLNFFAITPSIRFNETINFRSIENVYDPTLIIDETAQDTIFGEIVENTINDLSSFEDLNVGASLTTSIYGTLQFKKGKIRGIRHVIKPSISFSYHPDLSDEQKFLSTFDTTGIPEIILSNPLDFSNPYNILSNSPFGGPSTAGERMTLSYSLEHLLEAKIYSKKDSTEKKLKFFDRLNMSGSYNFLADSFNLSPLRLSATTRLFKGKTRINFAAVYDFYEIADGVRQNEFVWNTRSKPLRFDNASIRISTSFRMTEIFGIFQKEEEPDQFHNLFDKFNIRHNFVLTLRDRNDGNGTESDITTHTVSTNGSIQLTPKWRISVSNIGYDFLRNGISYPDLGFVRDLHCWEMSIRTQPVRGTFQFYLRVKPGSLGFLSIPFERSIQDTGNLIF